MRIEGAGVQPQLLLPREVKSNTASASFASMLQQGLAQVNALQSAADEAIWRLAAGQADNLHEVMIAVERASIALELTIAIRNKLVEAYQEIMRMQV
ncbi:MAG TPA: flagellar hook-basal body complex protein FliE [Limnochordales bacterium]